MSDSHFWLMVEVASGVVHLFTADPAKPVCDSSFGGVAMECHGMVPGMPERARACVKCRAVSPNLTVEMLVGPRAAVWQSVTFARESTARDFIALCQSNGIYARPYGKVGYRHDYDAFTG